MAKSPNNTNDGKIYIGADIDSEIADIMESEAARTPGGMDAFLEQLFRAALN